MHVVAEQDVKKESRNRITLPSVPEVAQYEHYHVTVFDDGHLELHPRVLADATISLRTLHTMDAAMDNLARGVAGPPVDPDALLAALGND